MRHILGAPVTLAVLCGAMAAAPGDTPTDGGAPPPRSPPQTPPDPPPQAASDRITLRDGPPVTGEIFDITEKKVVMTLGKDRKTFPKERVSSIERAAPANLLALFRRKFEGYKASGTLEDWKGLALFCAKEKMLPERRQVLREIVRVDPGNAEARGELGHALLRDKWLEEDEVEAKRKEGYQVAGGKIVIPSGPTVVKGPDTPSERYHLLQRTKLSAGERKRMEKERADRLRSADKFLEMKEKEYQGIDWARRHIIRKPHFEIHCNSTRKVADAYGALMELIRSKLEEMFTSKIQRNLRAPVYIYASQEEFMAHDTFAKFGGRGLGGYYRPDTQAITTFHGTFGFTGTTFGTLCHEGTHYYEGLVLKDFSNVPIWLIEGLAVYFGDGSLFDPRAVRITVGQIPRDRLAHIQEKMLIKRHTPVAKLVTMGRSVGRGQEPFTGSHYADAWALIYFLVNSGDKGKNLLMNYWRIGLEQPLKKEHFTELSNKFFGSIESLEKQYVDYTLKLDMPSAGKVVGDYFVSDTFQFDFKAPGDEWEFFEDKDDKKLLVGLVLPGSSAEIRLYYVNNDTWEPADRYFEAYQRAAGAQFKNLKSEKVKAGKLEWFKMAYSDEGGTDVNVSGELGGLGLRKVSTPEQEKDRKEKRQKKGPRNVIRFLLVQIDGVVDIECSASQGEARQLEEMFGKVNESFTLSFTRRW